MKGCRKCRHIMPNMDVSGEKAQISLARCGSPAADPDFLTGDGPYCCEFIKGNECAHFELAEVPPRRESLMLRFARWLQ